jgi:hypothetical protein
MKALVHAVDHANKCFEANHSGWRDVISSTNGLPTCRDLVRLATLCNEGYDAVEGEYYLYENWQFLFLGCPTYIRIRNEVEGQEEVEGSNYIGSNNESWGGSIEYTGDANTSSCIISGLRTLSGSSSVRKRHLGTANLRYVHILLIFIAVC